ncbi:DnaJ domain protein [Yasminevirus sp. GU-2018]|uniref:DnaJ domain protein n=1 Tax=Yasminevirus sp. GU-2018 TaxID=2420051 RepID=A0A5K0U8S3_9VIRU|nr:DnaJ domain protein [Yasminevirus sp. GU-2018]
MSKVADTKLYDTLNVRPDSGLDEIKKSFRKLALQWHPDKWSQGSDEEKKHAEDMFKELTEAYTILSDPKKRELYDKVGLDGMKNGGQREMTEEEMREMFEGMGFRMPFGMGGRRKQAEPTMPKLAHTLRVSMKDVFMGSVVEFEVDRYILKKDKQPKAEDFMCKGCKGKGSSIMLTPVGPGMMAQSEQKCRKCKGEGSVIPDEFFETKKQKFTRTIPKGVMSGEEIVIENKGHEVPECFKDKFQGKDRTDVVLTIMEDREMEIETDAGETVKYVRGVNKNPFNLALEIEIDPHEAICGTTRYIPYVDGTSFAVKIPAGVIFKKGSNAVVVPNKGMPYFKQNSKQKDATVFGDLYIILNVRDNFSLDDQKLRQIWKIFTGRDMKQEVDKALKKSDNVCTEPMTVEAFKKSEHYKNSERNHHAFIRSLHEKMNSQRSRNGHGHPHDDDDDHSDEDDDEMQGMHGMHGMHGMGGMPDGVPGCAQQ